MVSLSPSPFKLLYPVFGRIFKANMHPFHGAYIVGDTVKRGSVRACVSRASVGYILLTREGQKNHHALFHIYFIIITYIMIKI